ncbi:MAG TPA: flagellar basal body L-ring protein FlgH [Deltaproteobacteria bacterium]|nr:flagellar basal body L-ring protein FlgH [Deltaproteobacteria bacterium]
MRNGIVTAALAALIITGCATPEPKKIDTRTIAVQPRPYPSSAGSLWPGETSRNNLYQDLRAWHVGDVVTITIAEKTSATKEAITETTRKSKASGGLSGLFGITPSLGSWKGQGFTPTVNADTSAQFEGEGKTERKGELKATLTAVVVEVLGNGNLVIEGKKDTVVNNETQYVTLSGIVRPEDIDENNEVSSVYVANARIEYSGRGVVGDEQSPGWLRRALDNVWPF